MEPIIFSLRVQVFFNYLKNRFIRKGNFREKIGHGKERGLELFTNSCHFIENENM